MTGAPRDPRTGAPAFEIQRGAWEDRLRAIDAEARRKAAPTARWALLIESSDGAGKLVAAVKPLLGEDVLSLQGKETPMKIGALLPRLLEAHADDPLLGVAVIGTGDRDDAKKAGWQLGPLAALPWVFAHTLVPESGLVPTVGEKVAHYLDVIEGLAFSEGPRRGRR